MDWLIHRVMTAREEIACSLSKAWFRGQTDRTWKLQPSILRGDLPQSHSDRWLRRQREAAQAELLPYSSRISELVAENRRVERARRALATSMPSPVGIDLVAELERLKRVLKENQVKINIAREAAKPFEHRVACFLSLQFGERDAFHDFSLRRGYVVRDSWLILAEMQHYGVRTRMLDWSESSYIGMMFALADYYRAYRFAIAQVAPSALHTVREILETQVRGEQPSMFNGTKISTFDALKGITQPRVWVLNPFRLARLSESFSNREFPSLSGDADAGYYRAFLEKGSWPHARPYPVRIPWSEERIRNQKGFFTVWGHNEEPLEKLNDEQPKDKKFLAAIDFSVSEALEACQILSQIFDHDLFDLYLSVDHLGEKVNASVFQVMK